MPDISSPRSPLSPYRAYTSFLTPSLKTHALIKKPLTRLVRRTSDLVDSITGGAIADEQEEERKQRAERERKNTCKACRVVFAGERELNKTIEENRQGRRSRQSRHATATNGNSNTRRSKDGSGRNRTTTTTMTTPRYTDAPDDFENIGPFAARAPPVQSRSGPPPRTEGPSPLIDYGSRNERQGRQSAAQRAEEEALRRSAQAAYQSRSEQVESTGVTRRSTAGVAIARGMRRGLREGMISALATMPTRTESRPTIPPLSFQEQRSAGFDGRTFNPLTGEMDRDSEPEWDLGSSAIHGETQALQVAPTAITFRTGFSSQDDASQYNLPATSLANGPRDTRAWDEETLVDEVTSSYSFTNTRRNLSPHATSQLVSVGNGDDDFFRSLASSSRDNSRNSRPANNVGVTRVLTSSRRSPSPFQDVRRSPATTGRPRPLQSVERSRRNTSSSREVIPSRSAAQTPMRTRTATVPVTHTRASPSQPHPSSPGGDGNHAPRSPPGRGATSFFQRRRARSGSSGYPGPQSQHPPLPLPPPQPQALPSHGGNLGGPLLSHHDGMEGGLMRVGVGEIAPPLANLTRAPGAPAFPPLPPPPPPPAPAPPQIESRRSRDRRFRASR